jgi:PAS domain-containing protein
VAQIDLSVSRADVASEVIAAPLRLVGTRRDLGGWLSAVQSSEEACLVLDRDGIVVGASVACELLFGAPARSLAQAGSGLLDAVNLIDFSAARNGLALDEIERIPPLAALSNGTLARGLMRLKVDGSYVTLDAVATPLRASGVVAGSLTFFYKI